MASLCFGMFWSAAAPGAGRQLPPRMLLDQLLLRAERLIEADDLDSAVEARGEASALAAEHELELPPDFRFEQARTEFAVGLLGAAKESVTAFLAGVSPEAESYLDAVALLEDVDRILERRDAPDCTPEPEGSACWRELTSHAACYVWNPGLPADATANWTGDCSDGFAQSPGTVTWTYRDGELEQEGNRRYGRLHGDSAIRGGTGWANEGPNRFGKAHGHWVLRSVDGQVDKGPYEDGKRNGHWVFELPDGGRQEGPYEDGEKNGHWVLRFASGQVEEGPYVDGEKNGHWVLRFADGQVDEGPYVDGEKNGHWVLRFAGGQVERGGYADGERHGGWTVRSPDGHVTYVEFVRGVRQEP